MAIVRRPTTLPAKYSPQLRLESRPTPWFPIAVGGVISGLLFACVAAAAVFRVDQIVPVPGRLQPIRSTQDLSPPEPGIVSNVVVKEGERVKQGQPLVLLNPVILEGRQEALQVQSGQIRAIAEAELERLRSAIGEAESEIQGLTTERGIILEQLNSLTELEKAGGASRFQLLDYQRQLSDIDARLQRSRETVQKLQAESLQKQAELRREAAENRADRVETAQRLRQIVIRAPLDGTILNLMAKRGLVARADEVLLQLVPFDNLQASVFVSNRDLAFVRPGQQAELTVEAYDPLKFGRIPATVKTIATDALPPDETIAYPHFPVTLALSRQTFSSQGKEYPLQAGMAVTANLKLEQRTILDLLLSAISRSGDSVRMIR